MRRTTRRTLLAGAATAAAALTTGPAPGTRPTPARAAPSRGGTLRFVPLADLQILDPVWTNNLVVRNHGYLIYDTLFGTDAEQNVRPQMVERYEVSADRMRWRFTLRPGLRWHDGAPVTAEDCVVSLQRWGKRDLLGKLLLAHTARLEAAGERALVLELVEPFRFVLEALGRPSFSVAFMMPARVARTPPTEQIKEPIGSGPFRFVAKEWRPGHQVVYERNPDYVPREEPPSGTTGGKRVYLDRVVWRSIGNPATAAAALEAGEVDIWEAPPLDYVPRLERRPGLVMRFTGTRDFQGWLAVNGLRPPFDSRQARRALLHLVDQGHYLQTAVGQPKYFRTCPSLFPCGSPYATTAGAVEPDPERARALFREAGYDGRPVVVLDNVDVAIFHAAALATAERLRAVGVKADLQAVDAGTLVTRQFRREVAEQGGWTLIHTAVHVANLMTPAVHPGLTGAGDHPLQGWRRNDELAALRLRWVRAEDEGERRRLAEQLQRVAYEDGTYVPWGQYTGPMATRRQVEGVLPGWAPVFWNIWLDA